VIHGDRQLESRWKAHGRRVILDTVGAQVLLPGITDPGILDLFCGAGGCAASR
jgi:hypothetical protein